LQSAETDGIEGSDEPRGWTRRLPSWFPSRLVRRVSWLPALGLAAVALLILSARWNFPGELASHFRWHLGLLALICVLPHALLRQWRQVAALSFLAAWGVLPEGVLWLGSPPLEARGRSLDVVYANVLRPNQEYAPMLETILARDADVVGIVEISMEWRDEALAILGPHYPFHAEGLNTEGWSRITWGSMLFSKTPLTGVVVKPLWNLGHRLRPILRANVEVSGERVTIQLVHAQRPGRAQRLSDRKLHLEVLSRPIDAAHQIIIGDLNTTSTSPLFGTLCENAGVRDSRRGFGRLPSWTSPRTPPGPFKLKIPHKLRPAVTIDHALVSDGLVVLRRGTFVTPGSDHLGLFVRVGLED